MGAALSNALFRALSFLAAAQTIGSIGGENEFAFMPTNNGSILTMFIQETLVQYF